MFKKHFRKNHPINYFFMGIIKITRLNKIRYGKNRKIMKYLTIAKNKKFEV